LIRRVLSLAAIIVTALLLQTTVFAQFTLFGVRPELMYLVTILIAFLEGPAEGMVVGFAGGLAQDFLLNTPKGLEALTLTLLGYGIGLIRQYITSPSPLLPTVLVGVGTAAGVLFYEVLGFLLGQVQQPILYSIKIPLLTGLYGAVLTPFVYPILRRVCERTRPRRVAHI
jgi:rod shape-determining protein MreD